MKQLRLVLPALAFVAMMGWAALGLACDKDKTATAASGSATCTAQMAGKCTPEMMAACKANAAKAAGNGAHTTVAYTASATRTAGTSACSAQMMAACKAGNAATAATAIHCPGMLGAAMSASYDHCAGHADAATASMGDHCGAKTSAATAASSSDHCGASADAATAGMAGSCAAHTSAVAAGTASSCASHTSAAAAGAGQCTGHGVATQAARMTHGDCDACSDMALCEEELSAAGARTQVVPLRNGVMFVYTAQNAGKVNAVQLAMARRTERLQQVVSAGDKARLCAECKSMRGAMASGKLNREVVNIEGGALTLVTSNDPTMVAKIHTMLDTNSKIARKI